MNEILALLAGHFIGDFGLQSEWMADNKGKSWEINGYHALTYTSSVFLAGFLGNMVLPIWAIVTLLISHFIIDALKARYKVIKSIWLDQILHIIIIIFLAIAIT